MSRVKAPEARTPLRGRGAVHAITVAPAADLHGQLMSAVTSGDLRGALQTAASDAAWLRPADAAALVLAQLLADELMGGRRRPADGTDEVGTVPAFGELVSTAKPTLRPGSIRELAPLLVQLLTGLGMLPEARSRLGILLVESAEPMAPTPRRIPRTSR